MLILPLHRKPTWANFPWATFALILANVFVFCFPQSGDDRVRERALDYYASAGLAQQEFPAYREWLSTQPDAQQRSEMFEAAVHAGAAHVGAMMLQSDRAFVADLDAGRVIAPQAPGYALWREHRDEFERQWDAAFTERWMLHFSEFDPRRMLGAMFLHGGFGHLLGNMLFLALLGLLVEGALGPWLFLAVYLLGGLGSAMLSLAWRWGESGSALGASGAIASLMGAYCVLWGLRKVRFFWWFLVAFDYVKAPALVLLPFWLGWELVNLAWNKGAHVGFDAHAGGIVTGALLALGVRALGWERREFLDEDTLADAAADDRAGLAKAQQHLGRLEIPAARALLEPIAQRRPEDFDVRVALYRCARYEPRMPQLDAAARQVLTYAANAQQAREQKTIFDDYRKAGGGRLPLSAAELVDLAKRWPAIGFGADAAKLVGMIIARAPTTTGLAAAALALARELRLRAPAEAKQVLGAIERAWPASPEADKARLLLAEVA